MQAYYIPTHNIYNSRVHFIISLIILIISPLFSVPIILAGIYYGDRRCSYLLAVLSGIWSYLTPPFSDLYRWTEIYNIINQSHNTIADILLLIDKGDYITQIFSFFLARFDIPYPFARFTYITISMTLLISIFYELCPQKISYRKQFWLLLIFLGFFNYYQAIIGVRHGFASCLFFYGYVKFFYLKRFFIGVVFMSLAGLTHSFFWGISAIALFTYLLPVRLSNSMILVGIVILYISGTALSTFVFQNYFEEHEGYVSGTWGADYTQTISDNGLMYLVLMRLGLIPLIYFFLKFNFQHVRIRFSIIVMIFALSATSGTLTLAGRFLDVVYFVLAANMVTGYQYMTRRMLKYLAIGSIICVISSNYAYRSVYNLNVTQYYRLIYPLPFAMEETFTSQWVGKHINSEGAVR